MTSRKWKIGIVTRFDFGHSPAMNSPQSQPEMDFTTAHLTSGYESWQEQRRAALRTLALQLGLPIGHEVEVWLRGGIVLKGKLRLREELIFLDETRNLHVELVVGRTSFTPTEIEACVRTD